MNPVWNESFTCEFKDENSSALKIVVESKKGSPSFLGYCVVTSREIKQAGTLDKWVRLHTNTHHEPVSGQLHVICSLMSHEQVEEEMKRKKEEEKRKKEEEARKKKEEKKQTSCASPSSSCKSNT